MLQISERENRGIQLTPWGSWPCQAIHEIISLLANLEMIRWMAKKSNHQMVSIESVRAPHPEIRNMSSKDSVWMLQVQKIGPPKKTSSDHVN